MPDNLKPPEELVKILARVKKLFFRHHGTEHFGATTLTLHWKNGKARQLEVIEKETELLGDQR